MLLLLPWKCEVVSICRPNLGHTRLRKCEGCTLEGVICSHVYKLIWQLLVGGYWYSPSNKSK